jgi:hypothetical protein
VVLAVFPRSSKVYGERATLENLAMHHADGFLGVGVHFHLDERETSGLTGISIGNERDRRDWPGLGEKLSNLPLSC